MIFEKKTVGVDDLGMSPSLLNRIPFGIASNPNYTNIRMHSNIVDETMKVDSKSSV